MPETKRYGQRRQDTKGRARFPGLRPEKHGAGRLAGGSTSAQKADPPEGRGKGSVSCAGVRGFV